ncbi:MAG: hypothetical protein ACYDCL_08195 [Myxococcales bacterium]
MGITSSRRLAFSLLLVSAPVAAADPVPDSTPAEISGAKLIDSVVAIAGRRVITLSQLRGEARIALAEHGSIESAEGPLTDGVLSSTLDYVISEDLVEEEAARLGVFPVTNGECQVAEESLSTRLGGREAFEGFLARFDIDHERLTAILRRSLRASRYLESRLRLQAQATERQVDELLARAVHDASLPQARPLARAYLQRERYQALAAKLVADLRARADVRILASFGASAGVDALPGLPDALPETSAGGQGRSSALLDPPRGEAAP